MSFTGLCQSTLSITVNNIKNDDGLCSVALYANPEAFPGIYTESVKRTVVKARKGTMQVKFDHVPAGVYAIAIIHDENGDGKLNTNFIGIPTEGYGASNNHLPATSAPKFSASCFTMPCCDKTVSIDMKYYTLF